MWSFKKKTPAPTARPLSPEEQAAAVFRRLPIGEQLAWFDSQQWAPRAMSVWREFWEERGLLVASQDRLARLRFMGAWDRAEKDGVPCKISLPFIGMTADGGFLQLDYEWKREQSEGAHERHDG